MNMSHVNSCTPPLRPANPTFETIALGNRQTRTTGQENFLMGEVIEGQVILSLTLHT